MDREELLEASDALIFSRDLQELERKLVFGESNLWHILGIGRKEDYVTRFLAWLMDPKAEHGQGDLFFKSLIVEALRADVRPELPRPVEISITDFSDLNVETQAWLDTRRCDVLLTDDRYNFLCIIENKVGAKEGRDQTKAYYEKSLERYPFAKYSRRLYLYLSPMGAPPSSPHFLSMSYDAVLQALQDLLRRNTLPESVAFLVHQFYDNLRRYVAMDRDTLDLVQAIYDAHRDVIDFIYENAERPESDNPEDEWDGKSWFFNIGETGEYPYSWEDSKQYSFIAAGGGPRYRRIMQRFKSGDVIYAYVSRVGYVGIGTVKSSAVPFAKALLADGKTSLASLKDQGLLKGNYFLSKEEEKEDWVVAVNWQCAVGKERAVGKPPVTSSTCSHFYEKHKALMKEILRLLQP